MVLIDRRPISDLLLKSIQLLLTLRVCQHTTMLLLLSFQSAKLFSLRHRQVDHAGMIAIDRLALGHGVLYFLKLSLLARCQVFRRLLLKLLQLLFLILREVIDARVLRVEGASLQNAIVESFLRFFFFRADRPAFFLFVFNGLEFFDFVGSQVLHRRFQRSERFAFQNPIFARVPALQPRRLFLLLACRGDFR